MIDHTSSYILPGSQFWPCTFPTGQDATECGVQKAVEQDHDARVEQQVYTTSLGLTK